MSQNKTQKTVNISLGLLMDTQPPFKAFMHQDMPASMAHPITRLYKRLEAEVIAYAASEKTAYLRHGDMQPDESILPRPDEVAVLNEEINDLRKVMIDIVVPVISTDDLDLHQVHASPAILLGLDWWIDGLDAYDDIEGGKPDDVEPVSDDIIEDAANDDMVEESTDKD